MKIYHKTCDICNKPFEGRNGGNKCQTCSNRLRRMKLKIICIEYRGGKCHNCNYSKCYAALDFHHIHPIDKDFTVSERSQYRSFEQLQSEIDKCILLCSNCHRELHNGFYVIDEFLNVKDVFANSEYLKYFNLAKERLEIEKTVIKKPPRYCKICNKKLKYEQKIYCSRVCSHKLQFRVIRPDYAQLMKELYESNYTQVGKKYGVSDNAVRKWIKQYQKLL